jgi:predicted RNA-binding Zn-ribbon protein involved in translation (DUF1610 family)
MVNYRNTKIYYIRVGGRKYYGHTAQPYLKMRENDHKVRLRANNTRPLYVAMREANMNVDDIVCVWVENYPCNNKDEARAREQWWFDRNDDAVNARKAYVSEEEKKEQKQDYNQAYYYANHDKMLEKNHAYQEANRDELNRKKREKRAENREENNAARRAAKWSCPHCGIEICKESKARHLRRAHPTAV